MSQNDDKTNIVLTQNTSLAFHSSANVKFNGDDQQEKDMFEYVSKTSSSLEHLSQGVEERKIIDSSKGISIGAEIDPRLKAACENFSTRHLQQIFDEHDTLKKERRNEMREEVAPIAKVKSGNVMRKCIGPNHFLLAVLFVIAFTFLMISRNSSRMSPYIPEEGNGYENCTLGYFSNAPGSPCLPCRANTYSNKIASSKCKRCPDNSSSGVGQSICLCDEGFMTTELDDGEIICRRQCDKAEIRFFIRNIGISLDLLDKQYEEALSKGKADELDYQYKRGMLQSLTLDEHIYQVCTDVVHDLGASIIANQLILLHAGKGIWSNSLVNRFNDSSFNNEYNDSFKRGHRRRGGEYRKFEQSKHKRMMVEHVFARLATSTGVVLLEDPSTRQHIVGFLSDNILLSLKSSSVRRALCAIASSSTSSICSIESLSSIINNSPLGHLAMEQHIHSIGHAMMWAPIGISLVQNINDYLSGVKSVKEVSASFGNVACSLGGAYAGGKLGGSIGFSALGPPGAFFGTILGSVIGSSASEEIFIKSFDYFFGSSGPEDALLECRKLMDLPVNDAENNGLPLSVKVLSKSYRKVSRLYHPDVPGGSNEAFNKLTLCYGLVLQDINRTAVTYRRSIQTSLFTNTRNHA